MGFHHLCIAPVFEGREKFDDLCFEFGIELDDVVEDGTVYKIEVPANRHDLLCAEGLSRALKAFTEKCEPPCYGLSDPRGDTRIFATKEVSRIRAFVFGAVLRNVSFSPESFASFIDLQDKIHQNLGRRRTIVAIGTHDLDTIQGPMTYDALPPSEICFVPLNETKNFTASELMKLYENHVQLKQYLPIIRSSEVYPVIKDCNGTVLSMPPIINSHHTHMKLSTSNVFIEVTATDKTKGEIALNTLVAMFSEYCEKPFQIEPVEVNYGEGHLEAGGKYLYPNVDERQMKVNWKRMASVAGISDVTAEQVCEKLKRMMIHSSPCGEDELVVRIPITRSDIMHECDLAEDLAIGYGLSAIEMKVFPMVEENPVNALTNQMRRLLPSCGYCEVLNWGLCSLKDGFEYLLRTPNSNLDVTQRDIEYDGCRPPATLASPKTREFEMVRTSLLPGLIKSLAANKGRQQPIKLFELGDVVVLSKTAPSGARNIRHLAILYANHEGTGLEEVHGVLDVIMARLGWATHYDYLQSEEGVKKGLPPSRAVALADNQYFTLTPSEDNILLEKRRVNITVEPQQCQIGIMGVLHPTVLKAFGLTLPVSVMEINLEVLCQWMPETKLLDD